MKRYQWVSAPISVQPMRRPTIQTNASRGRAALEVIVDLVHGLADCARHQGELVVGPLYLRGECRGFLHVRPVGKSGREVLATCRARGRLPNDFRWPAPRRLFSSNSCERLFRLPSDPDRSEKRSAKCRLLWSSRVQSDRWAASRCRSIR